jgi:sarcosine oxidase
MTEMGSAAMPPERADVVVVGAGLMGGASAWHAARRGLKVVVLEQFEPATVHGSSHGSARIVRRAYPQDDYVRLTGEAFELWRELEHQSGRTLLRMTGGLDHGSAHDLPGIAAALERARVPGEWLTADDAQQRWPGMVFAGPVLHHPQAGTVDAAGAVEAFLEVAQRGDVVLHTGVTVERITPDGDGGLIDTSRGQIRAARVVVAAGAWCEGLIGGLVPLPPLTVTEHRVFHFPRADVSVTWPVTIHRDALDIYHLPGGRDGGPGDGRKIAQHTGRAADPRHRDPEVDEQARVSIVEYVQRWLPGLVPEPFGETTCLYTRTPTEDFVIDRVGPVTVASACSGHGAKLSPVVGRLVADQVTSASAPLRRFALATHSAHPASG